MKTKNIIKGIGSLILVVGLFNSCKKNTTVNNSPDGKIAIRLTDSPGDYQQVNVDIRKVSVHMNGGAWIDLPTHSGVYDLLLLQNGIDTSLVDTSPLPPGRITQMRLLLGNNNSVMVDSVMYNLTVPSGNETGIKLIGNISVIPNQTVLVRLDFNAAASVVLSGSTYQLKPAIQTL